MDSVLISAIAAGIVNLLTPIIQRVGKGFVVPVEAAGSKLMETIGQKAGQSIAKLLSLITKKFQGDSVAQAALDDFMDNPIHEDNQASLRKELEKVMNADGEFAEQLEALFKVSQITVTDSSTTTSQADSGTIVTQGGTVGYGGITIGGSHHNIEGGIHINEPKK